MMNRKLFAGGSGVIIDVCRVHGAFFDVGELPKIIAFVMNGGLEQAQKKELSRMKDDAKREQHNAQFATTMASRSSSGQFGSGDGHTAANAFVDLLFALWR